MRARRSVRTFLPTPLPPSDIRAVLEGAQAAPSNCNTQPWTVHIVSGAARDALSGEILKADDEGRFSSDYADFGEGTYLDRAARKAAAREGLKFFGAPHAAFLFMPAFGDGVRAAGDIGMYVPSCSPSPPRGSTVSPTRQRR